MKVAIVGSRSIKINYTDIEKMLPDNTTCIITGGAVGVDRCAEIYAKNKKILLEVYKPNYEKYGRAATHIRNREIFYKSEYILCFWDGKSRGTKSMIDKAYKVGKQIQVVRCDNGATESKSNG